MTSVADVTTTPRMAQRVRRTEREKNVGPDDGPRVLCVACEVTDIERERSFGRDGRREGTEEKCRNSVGPGGSAWLGEDWPETIGLRDGPCEHDDAEDRHEDDLQREGREASRY